MQLALSRNQFVLGTLMLNPANDSKILYAHSFLVVPKFRRQGIGTNLYQGAEAWARQQDCRYVILQSRNSTVPFYEQLGFSLWHPLQDDLNCPTQRKLNLLAHHLSSKVPLPDVQVLVKRL
jgi:GNAT superfamily N-acetyltransferase